jgi:hypothetical protein
MVSAKANSSQLNGIGLQFQKGCAANDFDPCAEWFLESFYRVKILAAAGRIVSIQLLLQSKAEIGLSSAIISLKSRPKIRLISSDISFYAFNANGILPTPFFFNIPKAFQKRISKFGAADIFEANLLQTSGQSFVVPHPKMSAVAKIISNYLVQCS